MFHTEQSTAHINDETIALVIKPDFLSCLAAQTECLNPDKIELLPVTIDRDSTIEYIARSFLAEMQNDALGSRLYGETLATQLAIHLLRNYCTFTPQLKQYSGGLSRRQLKAAINYIEAHLENNIGLDILAQVSQVDSTHYFCRLFKQSMGITPYQYVIGQRVAKAKQLLRQTQLPIAEIAYICGFSNQSALTRAFKERVGTTPKGYRQQL